MHRFFTMPSSLPFTRAISAAVMVDGGTVPGVPWPGMFNCRAASVERQMTGFHEVLPGAARSLVDAWLSFRYSRS
jgi:hypothetical protein